MVRSVILGEQGDHDRIAEPVEPHAHYGKILSAGVCRNPMIAAVVTGLTSTTAVCGFGLPHAKTIKEYQRRNFGSKYGLMLRVPLRTILLTHWSGMVHSGCLVLKAIVEEPRHAGISLLQEATKPRM